ncbi:hypothetical protein [Streptomyces sp. Inha503]|uniref:hypothetical protein n=1 Tax=Streptomyces sp. Inha503 TaxID=3383314 RepID=UPI0039A2E73D
MIEKLMPLWGRARTAVLAIGGFSAFTAAAWMVAVPAGLVVLGVSCFALEYLTSPTGRTR